MKYLCLLLSLPTLLISCVTLDNGDTPSNDILPYGRASYTQTKTINKTIDVSGTFDGKNIRYIAGKSLGDGSQSEHQKPIFILKPGATLKNIIIDKNGADGVHVYSSDNKTTKILNCEWWDVGEDAITIKNGDNDANVLIKDCYFANAADKIIQINSRPVVAIEGCYGENFGRFVRTNGTKGSFNHKYIVFMSNTIGVNGKTMIRMTNSNARSTLINIKTKNVKDLFQVENGARVKVVN